MDPRTLQAWWFERQGLMEPDPSLSPAAVLAGSGWARSVGGVNPYLALFARAGTSRERAEQAVAALEIHELPCARGCTYVVPRSDYAIALKAGQGFSDEAPIATARKYLGVTEEELDRLVDGVLAVLADGPLDPREIRTALGDTVRNLGDEGKKRGQTTTLPLALGRLQSRGQIRRLPVNGRLDQERYRYARWAPSPLDACELTREEAWTELARRYFRWTGPAAPQHFQWFSGLGVKVAKEAIAPLGLVPLEPGSDHLLFPEDLESLRQYRAPETPRYALVGSIDGITHLRRDVQAVLSSADRLRQMAGERGIQTLGGVQDLASHGIFDRGRLVGLWEFDPGDGRIAWNSFVPRDRDLEAAVARTETFVRDELGDARSFSLDSPQSRLPRLQALRAPAGV